MNSSQQSIHVTRLPLIQTTEGGISPVGEAKTLRATWVAVKGQLVCQWTQV